MDESTQSRQRGCKHQWTYHEDCRLVEALVELSTQRHWKAEGSGQFKSGYLKELERMLEEKMPGCGLRASPHIESRVKLFKKQYGAIAEMLGPRASGFGWDDIQKKIVVEREVFVEWVKSHPNAAGLYNKSFPFFNDLQQIYGRDRANGEAAEDPYDSVQAMEQDTNDQRQEDSQANVQPEARQQDSQADVQQEDLHEDWENIYGTQPPTPTFPNTQEPSCGHSSANKSKKRGRTSDDPIDNMSRTIAKLGSVYEATKNTVMELAACFKHEKEAAERRMRVIDELKLVDGLTNLQRMMAAETLMKDQHRIDVFFTIPTDWRKEYVEHLLGNT